MNTEETAKLVAQKFGFIPGTQNFNVVVKIFCEGAEYGHQLKETETQLPNNQTLDLMKRVNEAESKANGHFNTLMQYMHVIEDMVGFAGPIEKVKEKLKSQNANLANDRQNGNANSANDL